MVRLMITLLIPKAKQPAIKWGYRGFMTTRTVRKLVRERKTRGQFTDTLAYFFSNVNIIYVTQNLRNHVSNCRHFRLLHTPRGDRRRTQPYATGFEGRERFKWYRVLVDRNSRKIKNLLAFLPGEPLGLNINQDQVVIGTPTDKSKSIPSIPSAKALAFMITCC